MSMNISIVTKVCVCVCVCDYVCVKEYGTCICSWVQVADECEYRHIPERQYRDMHALERT